MGRLIRFVVALLVLHGAWRAGSAYWTRFELQDEMRDIALFAGPLTTADVHSRVLIAANRLQVPMDPERVIVRRQGTRTYINASYDQPIEILPRYRYPWTFELSAEGWAGAAFERR